MKKLLLPRLKQSFFFDTVKLKEYLAFAVIVLSSNPSVDPLPRTKITFFFNFLLYVDKLLFAPKIIISLPKSKFGIKKMGKIIYLNQRS